LLKSAKTYKLHLSPIKALPNRGERVITEIEIEGFKSLEKVRLKLGKLNLFVGANASGKSNFFESLRVLQGIGYGFPIDEILNGKPKSANSEVWEGIRGGGSRAKFVNRAGLSAESVLFRVHVQRRGKLHEASYSISINPDLGIVCREELVMDIENHFSRRGNSVDLDGSLLTLVPAERGIPFISAYKGNGAALVCVESLANMQNLAPVANILRGYGQRSSAERIGESGENFASLVKFILQDSDDGNAYLSWLRQLVPIEADEVKILTGALGEPLFALKRGALEFPAPILSDGTLRFAALTAAFFQPDMPDIITIEEIENGIHPTRVRLLLELLKSQSSEDGPQVFATTHSPVVLAWLDESDYETTFFCRRDEETGASIIKPLSEIPHLVELVKKQPLSELFTEGWMEGAF
jgi:predicted ATPase